jgi:Family of unknown function (DUF6130)
MTLEKLQRAPQADRLCRSGTSATAAASMSTERSVFFAATASALALGLLVFSSPNYGQTRTEASTPVDTAFAQSTVVDVENEPAPSLTVQPPLPGPLAQGVVFIPYRLENLRIVPVGGAAARDISPRVGHLHITLDDLPWQWADVATGKMTADEAKADCGHTCHVAVKGKDYIFHPYQTR